MRRRPLLLVAAALLAGAGSAADAAREAGATATVTSRSADLDGREGVVMFEGGVFVRYSSDYTMSADRLYMFLAGSNEVSRVVAIGSVAITNGTRVGTCAQATYRRRKGEIEMFGDGAGRGARLEEAGGARRSVTGSRIRFWLETEQAEADDAMIAFERKRGERVL